MKFGIIGCGHRATAYVRLLTNSITVLCDLDKKRLSSFKDKYFKDNNSIILTSSINKYIDEIDFFFICVPDYLHYPFVKKLLQANKNFCVEKPIAITKLEVIKINRLLQLSTSKVYVPFVLRYTSFFLCLKKLIKNEKVLSINLQLMLNKSHSAAYQRRWHRLSVNSGGILMTKSCHDIDIINWLLGEKPIEGKSFYSDKTFSKEPPALNCSDCDLDCVYRYNGGYIYKTPEDIENPTLNNLDLCVFNKDKDINSTQHLIIKYPSGVIATINIVLGSTTETRLLHIITENNTIIGDFKKNKIRDYNDNELFSVKPSAFHNSGDINFVNEILEGKIDKNMIKDALNVSDFILNKIN